MLSYRHGFHAGNHADVLKHFIFVQLLRHMAKKDKPFWCIDTHAGAALYSLESTYARKHSEFENGIARLWAQKILPEPLEDYVAQVRQHNPDGKLRFYPGSPQIGLQLLRRSDRLRLFELHTTESRLLEEYFSKKHIGAAAQQVLVKPGDGFNDLKSILPPVP
jgi:23S rRNA (adenine2030-N6)-methyltransferase